jgi:Flp pilus assembly protein CpaB
LTVGNRRTLIAAAAIVLAAVAGFGVYFYTSSADKRAEDQVKLVEAFIASGDIPKGMTGDAAFSAGLIEADKVLRGSVPPTAVTDASELSGEIASAKIEIGQYITDASFVSPSEAGGGSLAATIGGSDRVAITIAVTPEHGVAQGIAPGDRVDIYEVSEGAALLLEDVKVLAVGLETAANTNVEATPEGQATPPANAGLITFEVSRSNAQVIAEANSHGALYLALRSLASASGNRSVPASGR